MYDVHHTRMYEADTVMLQNTSREKCVMIPARARVLPRRHVKARTEAGELRARGVRRLWGGNDRVVSHARTPTRW
eukprot:9818492-Lingulodinium_polyedra.AAC.1